MNIRLHVFRHDPQTGAEAAFQTFDLELDPEETVAGALDEIQERHDPSLAFRFICNMKKCGECALMVNQTPVLACQKKVEAEVEVGPLPNLPLIKDLVIDRHRVLAEVLEASPTLKAMIPEAEIRPPTPVSLKLETCLGCLICQAMCPTLAESPGEFIGPLGLVWLAHQAELDPSDLRLEREITRFAAMCRRCGNCWKYCPTPAKGVVRVLKGRGEASGPGSAATSIDPDTMGDEE